MITTYVCGGLGNQLFQYATARGIAEERNSIPALDLSWYREIKARDTPRTFLLTEFKINAAILPPFRAKLIRILRTPAGPFVAKILGYNQILKENAGCYDDRVEKLRGKSYLWGYWQSHRYFSKIRHQLKSEIVPKQIQSDYNSILQRMSVPESVFLHVRRGDYVTNPHAAATHGTCSLEYYKRALALIESKVSRPRLFVFTDDRDWVRSSFRVPREIEIVSDKTRGCPIADLQLMRACRHGITANSSFSWWGAYLGSDDPRIIVAPERGFHLTRTTRHLYPSDWHLI